MLTFNNKQYAKNQSEFTNSCNGFYKKLKHGGVQIFNRNRDLVALLHPNKFCVNASIQNGRAWYMFGTDEKTSEFLGFGPNRKMSNEYSAFESMLEF